MALPMSALVYPAFAVAIALSKGGTLSKFARVNAHSPDTARKPRSLGVTNMEAVHGAVKRGMLISTGDGRYYINESKYRRHNRLLTTGWIAVGIVIAVLTVFAMLPDGT